MVSGELKGPSELHLDVISKPEHQYLRKPPHLQPHCDFWPFLADFSLKTHVQATKGQQSLTKIITIRQLALRAATKNIYNILLNNNPPSCQSQMTLKRGGVLFNHFFKKKSKNEITFFQAKISEIFLGAPPPNPQENLFSRLVLCLYIKHI